MKKLMDLIPKVLFFSIIIKDLIFKPDWPSAALALGLCAVYVFTEYYVQNHYIKALEDKIEAQNKKLEDINTKCGLLADSLGAIQIANRFKSMK